MLKIDVNVCEYNLDLLYYLTFVALLEDFLYVCVSSLDVIIFNKASAKVDAGPPS